MILVRKPKFELKDFPPKGHRLAHTVRSEEENWSSVARDYGFPDDPWAIIIYNFNTREPREVNWYLKELVGCERTTDGKNYSFSIGSTIYIPPEGWKPDYDELLRRAILTTLAMPHIQRIRLSIKGHNVNVSSYLRVANQVIDRAIRVRYDPRLKRSAKDFYDPVKNLFRFGWYYAPDVERQATIVHEATHAALDGASASDLVRRESEAAAYIAQSMFAWVAWGDGSRLGGASEGDALDTIFSNATEIAKAILADNTPAQADVDLLIKAIREHPWYSADHAKKVKYHGIP